MLGEGAGQRYTTTLKILWVHASVHGEQSSDSFGKQLRVKPALRCGRGHLYDLPLHARCLRGALASRLSMHSSLTKAVRAPSPSVLLYMLP